MTSSIPGVDMGLIGMPTVINHSPFEHALGTDLTTLAAGQLSSWPSRAPTGNTYTVPDEIK